MSLRDWLKRLFGGRSAGEPASPQAEMISCQEALSAVYEYLDGELDPEPTERVREHFEACARCYPHLRLEESFRSAIREASRTERMPAGLRERVLDVIGRARGE